MSKQWEELHYFKKNNKNMSPLDDINKMVTVSIIKR